MIIIATLLQKIIILIQKIVTSQPKEVTIAIFCGIRWDGC